MKGIHPLAQLLLRLALGIGFLLPVMDRIGWLGAPGAKGVAWGNWNNFVAYTHTLVPYVNLATASFLGLMATAGEAIFAIMLIIGYKTRMAAYGSFALTLIFALSMLFFADYRAPFTYAVFVVSFSSLLLAAAPGYPWSIDAKR
ncbi:DoxX family membrane protein [Chitinophaga sp. S165]|uniref:DoxX family membrane protein n=1 Tax=Chitinophaga sp. S165 TaxID=2135462 RepID=UPI000D71727A|nr:DoxX family membrane protein [Chitinophaga sp. S165]PWV48763.1 DoxX-like protein [Chitinophaga sp. S165]